MDRQRVSMGNGKTIVELCSVEIALSVWKLWIDLRFILSISMNYLKISELKCRIRFLEHKCCLLQVERSFLFSLCRHNLGPSFPGRLCLGGHRSLQLDWNSHILPQSLISCTHYNFTFISTLSTFTPQGLVASSRMFSIRWQIISRSERISANVWKYFLLF